MRFELTIRGLCVIAMKSNDKAKNPRPKNPERVDIIVPNAHGHKTSLVWDPADAVATVEPKLIVNTVGDRLGSFDLTQALELQFLSDTNPGFDVRWGPADAQTPNDPRNTSERAWMNWVPPMEAIGFPAVRIPTFGTSAMGVHARISLPFGKLFADDLVTAPDNDDDFLIWKFPNGSQTVVANKVMYVVDDVRGYSFLDTKDNSLLALEVEGPRTVRMCISNDTETVATDFTAGINALVHLNHVDVLVPQSRRPRTVPAPETVDSRRTGNRICTQVVNVWDDKSI